MAWALHSVPKEKREKALEQLTRGLKGFCREAYLSFTTTHTGTRWVRDRTIFANRAVVDYDFEWYNGMNLAGLWAYDYFSEGSESTRFIKKHWALISDIFAYAKGAYRSVVRAGEQVSTRAELDDTSLAKAALSCAVEAVTDSDGPDPRN